MKIKVIFVLIFVLYTSNVSGYGRAREGECPALTGKENCAAQLLDSEYVSNPCSAIGQDFECPGTEKCCDDGCGGFECKPAIGLPPLPVIEPHCISAEVRSGDQCEPANVTYCYANQCNKCCIHNSVCNPDSSHLIRKDECERKLCKDILCPGQGEICQFDMYHRAICECPTECPTNGTAGSEVCGSDGVTYDNECEMNMSACVTGDMIAVVNRGPCLPPTTRNPLEICKLPQDKGHGKALMLRYFFNKAKGICEGFVYYGQGGNENNFENYADCENHCAAAVTDVCVLPKLVGPCRAAFPRWYFNSKSQRCRRFTYGGCLGNGNNFETAMACNEKCICGLPKAEGVCLGYFPSWYYNAETGRCEAFVYGGCRGNMNRFYSKKRCQKACGGGEVDPFVLPKPRCYGKNKFNCRSIKKCLPVALRCNGVDNCGDNSDEENCDPCASKKCDFYSKCVTTKNNTAICDCPTICTADWRPVCASDNETYPNLCTMQVESCTKRKTITKIRDGNCNMREKSKCELEREAQIKKFLFGIFIPQCEEDGSYKPVQCHGSTGFCWCVDTEGNKQEETEVRFNSPNCTQEPPPTEAPFNICDISLCDFGRCVLVDGNVTCQCNHACPRIYQPLCGSDNKTYPNLCVLEGEECEKKQRIEVLFPGKCKPQPTEATKPKSKCEKERDAPNGLLPGAFTPECEEDGSYKQVQCHSSTGFCWCVDTEGNKLLETEVKFKRPNCTQEPPPTEAPFNICDMSLCDFGRCVLVDGNVTCQCNHACPRIYRPVCGSDNKTYPNLCVLEGEECERKQRIEVLYYGKCKGVDSCKGVKCPFYAECAPLENGNTTCECPHICTQESNPVCGSDGRTYPSACQMKVASCKQQKLITKQYDGKCAAITKVSQDPCKDVKCDFYAMCVPLRNGSTICDCPQICTRELNPVCGSDNKTYNNLCLMRVTSCEKQELITKKHDGECETRPKSKCEKERDAENGLLPGAFTPKCEEDEQPPTEITKPKSKCEKERDAPNGLLVGNFTPKCEEDGNYKQVQCDGSTGYCWCVDTEGNKLEETEVQFKRPNCTQGLPGRSGTLATTSRPIDPCEVSLCEFGRCILVDGNATCVCNKACPFIETPVCGSDNETYSNLCVMDSETCERKERVRVKHLGPCGTKSKCENERNEALSNLREGIVIPGCETDGTYSPKQCETSSGYCWCVTKQGEKVPGTQIRFKEPDCSKVIHPNPCQGVKCDFYATCVALDNGEHICDCPLFCTKEYLPVCASNGVTYGNECEMKVASCQKQELFTVESPGKCESQPTEATRPKSKCEKEREIASGLLLLGVFIPECEEDGSFKQVQCHESTGYCWCMDTEGNKLEETEVRFKRPNCTQDISGGPPASTSTPIDPCKISRCEFGRCIVVDGNATCLCHNACPFIEAPVCGSDNKTYPNLCVMDSQACERKEHVKVQYDGPCAVPTSAPTVPTAKAIPKCRRCPFSGIENVMKSFCARDNKFAIIGEIVNVSTSGRKISVKVAKRFKPLSEKSKFKLENTVEIVVKKTPKCHCDNLEFKANERYVLMGRKTKKNKVFVIRWKTGFVEKVSDSLVNKLRKKTQTWGFCARKFG